jgi:hypothetical protein
MTAAQFRKTALALPGATEGSHQGHADFRVNGKVFATLGFPDDDWGMVKLTPDDQGAFIQIDPAAYHPAAGAWGKRGATLVYLSSARVPSVRKALTRARQGALPASLR